jgi:hypothetical protein
MSSLNDSVFSLSTTSSYANWRDAKLAQWHQSAEALMVAVGKLTQPTLAEMRQLHGVLARTNFVGYHCDLPVTPTALKAFAARFGLQRLDENLCADEGGISAITVRVTGRSNDYIPYTNKPLSWHTDGYYNPPTHQIRAWLLHCVQPAAQGGENGLCDPEIAYIALREENHEYVSAFQHPHALTIPANWEGDTLVRSVQSGPVFSVDREGKLHMRYSARKQHIIWRDDPATQAAAAALHQFLTTASPYHTQLRLAAGEGILSNNGLHNRASFTDNPATPRLLYRARYFDRTNSEHNHAMA